MFIDNFSEQNNCQITFKMAELNKLLFNSYSDDEQLWVLRLNILLNNDISIKIYVDFQLLVDELW